MKPRTRDVVVMHLPKVIDSEPGRAFSRDLAVALAVHRPRIVLDCSLLRQIEWPAIYLLLRSLEEAIKRNGDVRLSSISESTRAFLDFTGLTGVFAIFETSAEAIDSFQPVNAIASLSASPSRESRKAAQSAVEAA
jgi:anti-anti-sigma factor